MSLDGIKGGVGAMSKLKVMRRLSSKITGMLLLTLVLSFVIKSIIGYAAALPLIGGVLDFNSESAPSGIEITFIPQNGGTNISTYTDSHGRFAFSSAEVPGSGNYFVEISADSISEYTGFPETFDIVSANPYAALANDVGYSFSDLSFTSTISTINTTVLDSNNVPVSSSVVTATTNGSGQLNTDDNSQVFNVKPDIIIDQETTDSNGNAVLSVLSDSTYTVCATAIAGGQYCNQNVASDTNTTIDFPVFYTASGTVTINTLPIPINTEVTLTSSDGLYTANAYTDSSGDFIVAGLPNDSYYLTLTNNSTDGTGPLQSFNMTSADPYVVVDNNDITLSPLDFTTSALSISVINENGDPIVNTLVNASNDQQGLVPTTDGTQSFITESGSTLSQSPTDSNGLAIVSVLEGESYQVCANNSDIDQQFCTENVASGSSAIIDYSSDYTVSGTVSLGAQPSAIVLGLSTGGYNTITGNTDSSGNYSLNNVVNGSYFLTIDYNFNSPYSTDAYAPQLVSNSPYVMVNGSNTTLNPSFNTETLNLNFVNAYGVTTPLEMLDLTETSGNPVYTSDGLESFSGSESGVLFDQPSSIALTVFPNQTYTICGYIGPRGIDSNCVSNISSNAGEVTIEFVSPPTISYSLSSSPDSNGWYSSPVTVTFNCDAEVLVYCSAPITLSSDGANQTVTGTAIDYNGVSTSVSASLNIDQTPPNVGTPIWSSDPINIGQSANLSVPVSDNLSGVVGGEYYIGNSDPGDGNGTAMAWNGTELTATLGSNLQAGTYQVNIRAEDAAGNWSAVTTVTLVINSVAPTITSAQIDHIDARTPISFTVTTTGTPVPSITESGTLPPGLTFTDNGDGTATISGQASTVNDGYYFMTITATNSGGSTSQMFIITVDDALSTPTIISNNSANASYGSTFSFTVDTTGDPIPTITKTGVLPTGLTFTNNGDGTATISGTPDGSANGVYSLTLNAHNNQGSTAQTFTITVSAPPKIVNIPNQTATVGTTYILNISSSGTPYPSFSSTTLPDGLTLIDNGNGTATISGTPNIGSGGDYSITVTSTNVLGSNSNTFILKNDEPLTITSASYAVATIGTTFNFQVTSTGYPTATYSLTGTLPSGLHFNDNTGLLSGTPKTGTSGSYQFTITASNSMGSSVQSFNLSVN